MLPPITWQLLIPPTSAVAAGQHVRRGVRTFRLGDPQGLKDGGSGDAEIAAKPQYGHREAAFLGKPVRLVAAKAPGATGGLDVHGHRPSADLIGRWAAVTSPLSPPVRD